MLARANVALSELVHFDNDVDLPQGLPDASAEQQPSAGAPERPGCQILQSRISGRHWQAPDGFERGPFV